MNIYRAVEKWLNRTIRVCMTAIGKLSKIIFFAIRPEKPRQKRVLLFHPTFSKTNSGLECTTIMAGTSVKNRFRRAFCRSASDRAASSRCSLCSKEAWEHFWCSMSVQVRIDRPPDFASFVVGGKAPGQN
jgi:hypothetical protein